MKPVAFFISLFLFVVFALGAKAGPAVTVVTGPSAPELESYAAEELGRQLKELFQAEVKQEQSAPAKADYVILIGSPKTNPEIEKVAGDSWPKELSDQGHLLKSVKKEENTILIVGGGSPVATLWAVYELGHSFGIRYMLHGDFLPVDTPEFTLTGYNSVLEPNISVRSWQAIFDGPASQGSWGLVDQKKLLTQLSKLKFNRVSLEQKPNQKDKLEVFPVSGDTAGRSVFAGAKIFENPDLAGKNTVQERNEAEMEMLAEASGFARELGIKPAKISSDSKILLLPLDQGHGGLLPQFSTSKLPAELASIRSSDKEGYAVKCSIPGDLNMGIYYLSRASFDSKITPAESLVDLVTPICGEGVVERLANGFAAIEEVSSLIEKEDPDFAEPDPKMFMENYLSSDPAPEWWAKATELYGTAVNEMYRGNTRARDGARPFILYQAKHFTFALHYMMAVDAARKAGIAREAKDTEAQVENLETAVEQMHNALGIYADVVRDNSDRGVIAILNKYAYRPLIKELDELPLP